MRWGSGGLFVGTMQEAWWEELEMLDAVVQLTEGDIFEVVDGDYETLQAEVKARKKRRAALNSRPDMRRSSSVDSPMSSPVSSAMKASSPVEAGVQQHQSLLEPTQQRRSSVSGARMPREVVLDDEEEAEEGKWDGLIFRFRSQLLRKLVDDTVTEARKVSRVE